ncbi:MAG: hypothetical protein JZU65_15690 [Chlorobium sp.]|nr:hypothetical protein [Chlorobium sp.]
MPNSSDLERGTAGDPDHDGRVILIFQSLFGDSLQTSPSYDFTLEQNTQKTFSVQLINSGSVARSATVEIINPHSEITESLTQENPISIAPGTTHILPIVIDAGTMAIGVYDDLLMKVTVDDGSILYSSIKLTITQAGAANLPDLSISSSDISSTTNADGTVTLTVAIHNKGSLPAANVQVRFFELDTQLEDTVIAQIPVNGIASASITVPMAESGDHLIRVVVNPLGTIEELDEANNEASKIVQVAGPTVITQGNMLVTGSLPSTVYSNALFTVSGQAVYDIYANGIRYTNYVVKGGTVQITVTGIDGTKWIYGDVHTDLNGNFLKSIQAPASPGTYNISMTVTDNTFIGKRNLVVAVTDPPQSTSPPPPPNPPTSSGSGSWTYSGGSSGGSGGGSWNWSWTTPPTNGPVPQRDLRVYSENIHFSKNNPAENEEITVFAEINYWATSTDLVAQNIPVNFYITYPGTPKTKIGQTVISSLSIGTPDSGSRYVYASWKNQTQGIYIVEVGIDPSYIEENMLNNAATRAIIVGNMESYRGAIEGQVINSWGGVGNVVVKLYDTTGSTMLESMTTDNTGHYFFENLSVADYRVHIVTPEGYQPDAETKPAQVVDQEITVINFSLAQPDLICGDLDDDSDVDSIDRNIIRSAFGSKPGSSKFVQEGDYDKDGDIDYSDYQLWYKCYKAFITK